MRGHPGYGYRFGTTLDARRISTVVVERHTKTHIVILDREILERNPRGTTRTTSIKRETHQQHYRNTIKYTNIKNPTQQQCLLYHSYLQLWAEYEIRTICTRFCILHTDLNTNGRITFRVRRAISGDSAECTETSLQWQTDHPSFVPQSWAENTGHHNAAGPPLTFTSAAGSWSAGLP